ncbi:MAG: tetratricopeptide repeat protein [Lewinellaceae bacterium]|nr:tetratricopeptide repeat protein [Saprospiraceae bacterium]MCB9332639.1 tetratricopeptide repeat protein [Lewinellaceae bacterium]
MAKRTTKKTYAAKSKKTTATQSTPERWMPWVAAGIAFILFATGFNNPMVAMDDHSATVNNPAVRDFSLKIFTQFNLGMYAPITWLGYALAQALGSGAPFWYHLLSAAVHTANVVLVFRLFHRLESNTTVAFFIALFFAIHPMQVEAVSWIAAFSTPLFALFSLLALNAYVRQTEQEPWSKTYWMALGFFVLACLSKSTAVALPLTLLVVDLWLKRAWLSRQAVLEKAPFFVLALGFGLLAFYSRAQAGHPGDSLAGGFSLFDRALMASHTVLFYWTKILLPLGLSIWYPFEKTATGGWPWTYYAAPVVLALILGLVWRSRNTAPFVFRGVLFYLVNIVLSLPFYTVGTFELRGDRYNYLAMLGIFALLAGLPAFLKDKNPKLAERLWIALAALGLFWLVISGSRIRDWRDTQVLIDTAVEHQGDNFGKAYLWKGMDYGDKGDMKGALESFSKAMRINPDLTDAYKFRGGLLGIAKQYERSLEDLDKYLEKNPDDPEILYNRSLTLVNLKRWQEALDDLNKTLELAPEFTRAYRARGNVRKELGDTEGGAADLQEFEKRSAADL